MDEPDCDDEGVSSESPAAVSTGSPNIYSGAAESDATSVAPVQMTTPAAVSSQTDDCEPMAGSTATASGSSVLTPPPSTLARVYQSAAQSSVATGAETYSSPQIYSGTVIQATQSADNQGTILSTSAPSSVNIVSQSVSEPAQTTVQIYSGSVQEPSPSADNQGTVLSSAAPSSTGEECSESSAPSTSTWSSPIQSGGGNVCTLVITTYVTETTYCTSTVLAYGTGSGSGGVGYSQTTTA
jgi:hypothetical protein